jgi:hypothetical protein
MRNTLMRACLGVVVASGLVGVAGCANSPESQQMQRRTQAIDSSEKMRKTLTEAYSQVQATDVIVTQLSGQQVGNLNQTYSNLRNAISKNRSLNEQLASQAKDLNSSTSQQLADWSYSARTISDDTLRDKSVARQEQVRQEQTSITQSVAEARAAYTRYIRRLDDIAAYAAQDLSAKGVADMKTQADQSTQMGNEVRNQFRTLDEHLNTFASAWGYDIPLGAQAAGASMSATQPAEKPAK